MKKKKIHSWGYRLLKPILAPIFKIYYHPILKNTEYIPLEGPVIIVGNHKHLYDQCLVIISTKRIINYMAKKEYFNGPWAWFFKITGCLKVDRETHQDQALEDAQNILLNGGTIGIFPEGTRNKTNKTLLPFKYGAVSLAKNTNALIVPFGITGDYKFRSKNLTITFGKPFKVSDLDLKKANSKLENIVKKLIERGNNVKKS